MKHNLMLTISSLLTILFMTLHLTRRDRRRHEAQNDDVDARAEEPAAQRTRVPFLFRVAVVEQHPRERGLTEKSERINIERGRRQSERRPREGSDECCGASSQK